MATLTCTAKAARVARRHCGPAFTALVNQQAAANGESAVGFLNLALNMIGTGTTYTACFHDITTGNNTNHYTNTEFFAASGDDLCNLPGHAEREQLDQRPCPICTRTRPITARSPSADTPVLAGR